MVAAGEDDALDAGQPGGLEHVEQAARVDAEEVVQRIGPDDAGEMNDSLHVLHHALDGRTVGDIGDDQLFVVAEVLYRPDVRQAQMAPMAREIRRAAPCRWRPPRR